MPYHTAPCQKMPKVVNYHHTSRVASCFIVSPTGLLLQALTAVPAVLLFKTLIDALLSPPFTPPSKCVSPSLSEGDLAQFHLVTVSVSLVLVFLLVLVLLVLVLVFPS